MQRDGNDREHGDFRRAARTTTAGRKPGAMPLARRLGRQIAREQFERMRAANDNAPADEAEAMKAVVAGVHVRHHRLLSLLRYREHIGT